MSREPSSKSEKPDAPVSASPSLSTRRLLAALLLAALAAVAIAALWRLGGQFGWQSTLPGPGHDLAETAAKTSREVASLILEAENVALSLVKKFPRSADAMHVLGYVHYRFGKAEKAIEYWQRCIELDPGFVPAYVSLGTLRQEGGDHAAAEQYFRKAMELEPGSSVIPVELAQALITQGKLAEAARLLQDELKQHPGSVPAMALLGQCLVQLHRYEEARAPLERVVENAPGYTNAYYALATALTKLGQREKAAEYLKEFRKLKARDEQAHRNRLKALDDLGAVKQTVGDVYTNAAMAALSQDDPQTAEQFLLRAGELIPDYSASREVLAWLYQRQGRRDDALRILEELSQQFPDDLASQVTAGSLYAGLDQFDAAERAFQRAIELAPHVGGAYAALAKLYLKAGKKLPEARRLALLAADLAPTAENFLLLGMVCQTTGDTVTAKAAMGQAAITPQPDTAGPLPQGPVPESTQRYRFSPRAPEFPRR